MTAENVFVDQGRANAPRLVLLLAAALSLAAIIFHFAAGTPEVMVPLYAADLPTEIVAVLDVLWYDIALLMALGSIGMAIAAFRPQWRLPLASFIGGHYLALSVLCLGLSFVWFANPWGVIQWAIFLPLGLMTVWAARQ